MRVLVFGNINSGKSYLIDKISKQLIDYPIFKIDDFRIKYGKGTWETDTLAQEMFVESVKNNARCIVECTGLGPLGDKLSQVISDKLDIVLHVNTPLKDCIERLETKDFSIIPYPEVEETLENTIIRCQYEFDSGLLNTKWNDRVMKIITINSTDEILNIPFMLYSKFSKILELFMNDDNVYTIYPFGSFSRNEMTLLSDIDCFFCSKQPMSYFIEKVKTLDVDFVDNIKNKITLRYKNDLLIELVIVHELSDGERYIEGSLIDNALDCSLKTSNNDFEYLEGLNFENDKPIDNLDFLYSELIYFVLSLPKLIQKDNKYKYYFHFNIIFHNFIRISEILKGNVEYNYLPLVEFEEYKKLLIEIDQEIEEHFKHLLNEVITMLNENEDKYKEKYLSVIEGLKDK